MAKKVLVLKIIKILKITISFIKSTRQCSSGSLLPISFPNQKREKKKEKKNKELRKHRIFGWLLCQDHLVSDLGCSECRLYLGGGLAPGRLPTR